MFGKINKYLVLKADFNCKLMFCKINFILPNIYFTNLYSITLIKKTTPFQFFQLLAGPEKCLTTAGFFWEEVFAEKCKQESCGISVNLV